MGNLSLRMKLAAGFGALVAIVLCMGVQSYLSMRKLADLSAIAHDRAYSVTIERNIEGVLAEQRSSLRGFILDNSRHSDRQLRATNP